MPCKLGNALPLFKNIIIQVCHAAALFTSGLLHNCTPVKVKGVGCLLESKGSIRYYIKRAHLDMFRSHLSLSNTSVCFKEKGHIFH